MSLPFSSVGARRPRAATRRALLATNAGIAGRCESDAMSSDAGAGGRSTRRTVTVCDRKAGSLDGPDA